VRMHGRCAAGKSFGDAYHQVFVTIFIAFHHMHILAQARD
jgi:hypothetical protein